MSNHSETQEFSADDVAYAIEILEACKRGERPMGATQASVVLKREALRLRALADKYDRLTGINTKENKS